MNYRRHKKLFLSLIIFLLFSISISTLYAGTKEDIEKKVDEYISAFVKMKQFSGSILIAQNGRIIVNKGYGMANYEHEIPNNSQTKFRIASLTKQFTAMAIMILEEKKLLNVNDYLTKYIPDYPNGDKIKIVHLLTSTSGIPDHTELPDFNQERRVFHYDIAKTIETFKNKSLEFSPGEKFKYSNSGYILLGYIIEKVSNMPYGKYIEQNIFKPLNMNNSGFENTEEIIKHRASGYSIKEDKIINAAYRNMSNAHASGALYSTIEDLFQWDRALYTEKLIKKTSLEKMFTPFTDTYGYGWGIVNIFNRKMAGHNGEIEGFRTNITRFINDDACIIILSNFEQTPVGKISIDLAAILFGEEYVIPKLREIITVDPNILNDYVGKYEINPNFHFTITKENAQLYCQATGQEKFEIYPESETKFFLKVIDAQISFIRNENKEVEKLILHQGGRETPAKKVK